MPCKYLEKTNLGKKNPKISRMTKIDKHKTCAFSIFVKFTKKSEGKQIFNHEKRIMEKVDSVIYVMKNFHMIKV